MLVRNDWITHFQRHQMQNSSLTHAIRVGKQPKKELTTCEVLCVLRKRPVSSMESRSKPTWVTLNHMQCYASKSWRSPEKLTSFIHDARLQQRAEDIPRSLWCPYRESGWLVGWSKTCCSTNSFLPTTKTFSGLYSLTLWILRLRLSSNIMNDELLRQQLRRVPCRLRYAQIQLALCAR